MSKKHLASNQELPDEDFVRPTPAEIPKMDDMLALYEKVLAELDADIEAQQQFLKGPQTPGLTRDQTHNIITE